MKLQVLLKQRNRKPSRRRYKHARNDGKQNKKRLKLSKGRTDLSLDLMKVYKTFDEVAIFSLFTTYS